MNGTLDDQYLTWLYRQVGGRSVKVKDPRRTYWRLLRQMYATEFIWFVPNDDNRAEDGRDLRSEFMTDQVIFDVDPGWLGLGCSFLEMLVALAQRLSFEAEGTIGLWFWHLIETLGLTACTDASAYSESEVAERVEAVILRTYEPSGQGGLFPLHGDVPDQRDVEIWYQLSAWLLQMEGSGD